MKFVLLGLVILVSKLAKPAAALLKFQGNSNLVKAQNKEIPETWSTLDGNPTVLYAHRGDPVFVSSHTLPAYEIAAINYADYIEADLVLTKDGVLVCYHDVVLSPGTDIASHPEFDYLKTNFTGFISGVNITYTNNWFVQDLTLAQIKTLKVVQKRIGGRPLHFDGLLTIPTFQEYLDLVHRMTYTLGRRIGVIAELKYQPYLNAKYMEGVFLKTLELNGYALKRGTPSSCYAEVKLRQHPIPCPSVIIQSFDKSVLEDLSRQSDLDLMLLVYPDLSLLTYKSLIEMSRFVKYYCVYKELLYVGAEAQAASVGLKYDKEQIDRLGGFIPANQLVSVAHKLGMKMALFTIPDSREPSFRGCAVRPRGCQVNDVKEEMFYFFNMGVDAMFVENIPEKRQLRQQFAYELQLNSMCSSDYSYPQQWFEIDPYL